MTVRRVAARRAAPVPPDARALAAEAAALAGSLAPRVPPGPAGARARARLDALRTLPAARRGRELTRLLSELERDLAGDTGDPDAEHEALRALVHARHGNLLRVPELAEWLEAPRRHSAMLAWLLREHASKLADAGAAPGPGEEALRREIERLRAAHEAVARELEDRRALADVGLLAAGVVHDLNNLLTAIAGHAAIARAGDGPQAARSLDRVLEAAQRATQLSRSLTRWLRHERSAPEPLELSALAGEMLDLLAPSAPPRVRIERALATGLPAVMADPMELRRVALNLVVNAWQAIGDGPGCVRVTTGAHAGRVPEAWLEVADDGHGMSDDISARVFDPLFSTRDGGTGLGLATVQRLVERMDGRIEVWSAPGQGARFRVSLPARPPASSVSDRA